MRFFFLLNMAVYITLLSGCATRYIERNPGEEALSDNFGDVVVSQAAEGFKKNPPTCLGVLPFGARKVAFEPTEEVRKAMHSHLAPTGIQLIPIQKINTVFDKNESQINNLRTIAKSTGCATLLVGEVIESSSRFWGIYSEVKIGAMIKIINANDGATLWEGKHIAVVRDGGIPLNPITALTSAVSAGVNLRQEQVTRTTHDLARRLVNAIPGLKFTETPMLAEKISPPGEVIQPQESSISAFKKSLKDKSDAEVETAIVDALASDQWPIIKDREELAELLITKAPQNPAGYRELVKSKLATRQGGMAVNYGKKLVQLEPQNPDNQFLLGRAYLDAEKPEQAVQPLLLAAGSDLPKPVYFTALGLSYSQQGQYTLAIAAQKKALELAPNDQFALLQLGMALAFADDEVEAAIAIRKSIILAIANNERASAVRGMNALQSLGLENQFTAEEFSAIQEKIQQL
jgi:Flp pilus assembly protein TadD